MIHVANSKILNADKSIEYKYRYDNNFYQKGDQLIKDKVLLSGLKVTNKVKKTNFELEFPEAILFDETGETALELSEESSFRKTSLKTEKIYKSLYSPYYNCKAKNLEISYLKMLHKEFLKKRISN